MTPALTNIPVDVEVLADVLGRHRDYRVLRRMRPMDRRESLGFSTAVFKGACVDVETTGLDARRDRIIELAIQTFEADGEGRIVGTGESRSWLEDPGSPIPEEVTRVTGITAAQLKNRSISDGEAYALLASAEVIIAHNAAFDCGFVERRIPGIHGHPWACTLAGLDWAAMGFEGRTLSQLCVQMGWFYEAHRASSDVTALLHLLDHRLDDGATVLGRLMERERRPTWLIEAHRAPSGAGDVLKRRGYRWDAARRVWWTEVPDDRRDAELEWATIRIYHDTRSPESTKVDWTRRYSLT